MNTEEKTAKTRMASGAGGAAMLTRAKTQGRPIISPSEAPTDADEDPEGLANEPLDGKDLAASSSSDSTGTSTKPTGAMLWLGLAALGGAAWFLFGRKGKKTRRRRK